MRTIEQIAPELAAAKAYYMNLAAANAHGRTREEQEAADIAFYKARKRYYELQKEMDDASGGPPRPDDPLSAVTHSAPFEQVSLFKQIFG